MSNGPFTYKPRRECIDAMQRFLDALNGHKELKPSMRCKAQCELSKHCPYSHDTYKIREAWRNQDDKDKGE